MKFFFPLVILLGLSSTALAVTDTKDNADVTVLHAKGNILSRNLATRELVMLLREDGNYRRLTYSLDNKTDITREGRAASLEELERGDLMKVAYIRDGDKRSALRIVAFEYPEPAPKPVDLADNDVPLLILEPLPLFEDKPQSQEEIAKATEFVSIPPKPEVSFPKKSGIFVRQRWFNKDAFVVRTPERRLRHRDTYYLEPGTVVYQDDKQAKLEQLRRGDKIEVIYVDTGKKLLALEVQSNPKEVVASR